MSHEGVTTDYITDTVPIQYATLPGGFCGRGGQYRNSTTSIRIGKMLEEQIAELILFMDDHAEQILNHYVNVAEGVAVIHDDKLDSIWEGDESELWNYEKIFEVTGRSLESQEQREQEEYDQACIGNL